MKLTATVADLEKAHQDFLKTGINAQTCIWFQCAQRTMPHRPVYKVGYSREENTFYLDWDGNIWYLPPSGAKIARMSDCAMGSPLDDKILRAHLPVTVELYQVEEDE